MAWKLSLLGVLVGVALVSAQPWDVDERIEAGLARSDALYEEGDVSGALRVSRRTWEEVVDQVGEADPGALVCMGQVVFLLGEAGELEQAVELGRRHLELCERTFGEDDPATLAVLEQLAVRCSELGRHAEADALLARVSGGTGARGGEDDPEALLRASERGEEQVRLGREGEGIALQEEALAGLRRAVGEGDDRYQIALLRLADGYQDVGRPTEAVPLLLEHVAWVRQVFGEDHPLSLRALHDLAVLRFNLGACALAAEQFAEVYRRRRVQDGPAHEGTLSSLQGCVLAYLGAGDLERAEPLARDFARITREAFGDDDPWTWDGQNLLARVHMERGEWLEAEALLRACHDRRLALWGWDDPATLVSANDLGSLYSRWGRYEEARPLLEECVERTGRLEGPGSERTLTSLSNLAELDRAQGRYADAERRLRRVLEGRRALYGDENAQTLSALNSLGCLSLARMDHAGAESWLSEAYDVAERTLGPVDPFTLTSAANLAQARSRLGRGEEARALCEETLAQCRERFGAGDRRTSQQRRVLARLFLEEGDLGRAEALIRAELKRAEAGGAGLDAEGLVLLHDLGELSSARGDLAEAERVLRRCWEETRALLGEGSVEGLSTLRALGDTLVGQGRFVEGERLLRECEARLRARYGEESPQLLFVASSLSAVCRRQGRRAEAQRLAVFAADVASACFGPDAPETLRLQNHVAADLAAAGRLEEAEQLWRRCHAVVRESLGEDHPDALTYLNNLGLHCVTYGSTDEGLELLGRCLELKRQAFGPSHPTTLLAVHNFALAQDRAGAVESAEASFLEALRGAEALFGPAHPSTLGTVNDLASHYHDRGRHTEARALFARSLRDGGAWLSRTLVGVPPRARARLSEDYAKWLVSPLLSRALESGEGADRALAIQAAAFAHGLVVRSAREAARLERAERGGPVRALIEELERARRVLASRVGAFPSADGVGRGQELAALQRRVEELTRELGQALPGGRVDGLAPSELSALVGALGAGACRVQFCVFDPGEASEALHYAGLVLRHTGDSSLVDLGPAPELDAAVHAYRARVLHVDSSVADVDLEDAARRLYERVWAPLEGALEGAAEVRLVLDGSLHLLPFEALLGEDDAYLGERVRLSHVASRAEAERADLEQVAVVGNPDFGDGGVYGDLPGAEREGEALAETLSGTKAKVEWLSGAAATRERVEEALAARPQIVHLATHGFFHPYEGPEVRWDSERVVIPEGIDPLVRCGLVFAGVNEGRAGSQWTASEVLGLDLEGVELVVLSACQTGVGEVVDGEGVNCLGSAFLYAGADHVLTTLWPVDDEQTQAFVQEFYERYLGGASAEEALRATKLAFLEDAEQPVRGHPRHWAGFVLLGR